MKCFVSKTKNEKKKFISVVNTVLSRLNTGGVNLKLGPTFTRGPVFINGYFHHFWQKHKMNRNKMSPVSCVVDVIQNKGRRIYRMLIRGYNTFRQMYFVMFWYVTEVCRNVFIRLC